MKILFVEDDQSVQIYFQPKLEEIGEVIHVKSFKGAQKFLKDNHPDVVVGDHNILFWESDNENKYSTGDLVYRELRRKEMIKEIKPAIYIHFSSDKKTVKNYNSNEDKNFYSKQKFVGFDLVKLIKEIYEKN